jgi:hypothetical protein
MPRRKLGRGRLTILQMPKVLGRSVFGCAGGEFGVIGHVLFHMTMSYAAKLCQENVLQFILYPQLDLIYQQDTKIPD